MKKSLIALAALAVVGAASAQSSVTLYGHLDLGMAYNKIEQGAATSKNTSLAGAQGSRNAGRLGVRGTEDLGGGLKANFNIETNMNPDLAGTTFGSTRTAILQLQGAFGVANIGTYLNSLEDVRRGYSATIAGVAGGNFLENIHGLGIGGGGLRLGLASRSENAIGYRSPSFGGLDFRIDTTHEKTELNSAVNKATGLIAGVGYNNGPVSALLALGQGKAQSPAVAGPPAQAAVNDKINDVAFAVRYNLGVAVPYFQFENSKLSRVASEVKTHSYQLGSRFPMGAFTPYIAVSGGKIKTTPAGGATATLKTGGFQVGTTYDLSKRTFVYAVVGNDKNIAKALVGGTGDTKRNGYALGLVHLF